MIRALWLSAIALAACAAPPVKELTPPRRPSATIGSVRHDTGSFVGARETRLFEQSWRPSGDARAVLVIHHGLKSHSAHYAELAFRLTLRGFATYAYDMRGHGRSAGERASLDDFSDLVADLAQFLDRVRAREPERPIFVMGHSVGGAVVTLHQIERRPAIAGLIVLAPAIRIDRMPLEAAFTPFTGALIPNLPVVDVPDELFTRSPETRREMANDPLIYQPPGPARTAVGLLEALETIWARVHEIQVPIAGLHGTGDRATDPRGTRELLARVSSRDRTLLLYRGLYHDLVREPEREHVMDDIARWLDRRAPAP